MKYRIKSQTDVITNSSDETYIIKTTLTPTQVRERFERYMSWFHPDEWDPDPDKRGTYEPDTVEAIGDTGEVMVSWDVLCNLDNASGYLGDCFGPDNIRETE